MGVLDGVGAAGAELGMDAADLREDAPAPLALLARRLLDQRAGFGHVGQRVGAFGRRTRVGYK